MVAAGGLLPILGMVHDLHSRHADGASIGGRVQFIPRWITDLDRKVMLRFL